MLLLTNYALTTNEIVLECTPHPPLNGALLPWGEFYSGFVLRTTKEVEFLNKFEFIQKRFDFKEQFT